MRRDKTSEQSCRQDHSAERNASWYTVKRRILPVRMTDRMRFFGAPGGARF